MNAFGLRLTIAAPIDRVFSTHTEPGSVRQWFNSDCEIDLTAGRFDCWGDFSPSRQPGTMRLVACDPPSALSFTWRLDERETTVSFHLVPESPHETTLSLCHTGFGDHDPNHWWVPDFWSLALGNLASLAEGRPLIARIPFLPEAGTEIEVAIEIESDPEAIFRALTEPAELDRWLGHGSAVEPLPGGRFDLGWGAGPIRILEIVPGRLISYAWNYAESAESIVRWELVGSGGRTRMTLVHAGFTKPAEADGYRLGWQAALISLKRMIEIGPGWQRPTNIPLESQISPEE